MSRIAIFGMGYVGCVTAACLSRDGHTVIGVDTDESKVAEINAGESPVSEPGLTELVAAQVQAGRLRAVTNSDEAIANTDIALICVGTPSAADGSVSTRVVRNLMASI